jgi:hypothetical protein
LTAARISLAAGTIAAMILLCVGSAASAEPAPRVRREVDFLLQYIEHSGCEFNRNGTWHDAKAAEEHMRTKYEFLAAQDRIDTTEDFIEKAATQSSVLFGQPYTVKCDGDPPVRSAQWLSAELARIRAPRP